MAIYVDFSFRVADRHLVFVGWRYGDVLGQAFTVYDRTGAVRAEGSPDYSLHVRTDLPDPQAAGFVMVFDLVGVDALPPEDDSGEEVWTLYGEESGTVAVRYTGEDTSSFVLGAGDEAFYAVLGAVGAGRLAPICGPAARPLHERAQGASRPMLETDGAAAAFDFIMCDPEISAGMCGGWVLPGAGRSDVTASLLHLTPERIAGFESAFDCIPRPDLAGYGARFSVDGRRGFLATFSAEPLGAAPLFLLVLETGRDVYALARQVETARFERIAQRFGEATQPIEPRLRSRLRRSLVSVSPTFPHAGELAGPSTLHRAEPILLLEHDGRPRDLREVLGAVAGAGWTTFDLVLPGRSDGATEYALEGARRDHPQLQVRLFTDATARTVADLVEDGRLLVYLRSSLLIQSDVLPWLCERSDASTSLAFWEPRSGRERPEDPVARIARIAARRLSFAVSLRGSPAVRRLIRDNAGFLSLGGCLLWTVGRMPAGHVRTRVLTDRVFLGDAVASEVAIPGGGIIGFDMETIAAHA